MTRFSKAPNPNKSTTTTWLASQPLLPSLSVMRHLFSSFPLYLAASHVLVVDLRGPFEGGSIENLVMRTVGFCALVKRADDPNDDFDSDSD